MVARSLEELVADPTYLEFFGLRRPPFARLTEPAELFHTEQYSLLMEHLASAGKHADALAIVRGANGSGKSTLLHRYLTGLDDEIHCVVIDETCKGEKQFHRAILEQIGFRDITGAVDELRNIAREFIVSRGNAGDHVLVIVDNAHLIGAKVWEQLRIVSEVKAQGGRVISVVLAGSPGILRAINASPFGQARFHSRVVFNIRSYTEAETANYIWHRLRLAGGSQGLKVPDEVHPLIHRYSGGIPQLINTLCNYLLAEAYDAQSRIITEKIVRTVADRERLVPHVTGLHGKGRRRSDPDFEHGNGAADTGERISLAEARARGAVDDGRQAAARVDVESLLQRISTLAEQVDGLQIDRARALEEIDARERHIGHLRDELDSKTSEVEILSHSLRSNADDLDRQNQELASGIEALQQSESTAETLAAQLEEEARLREAAETSLAQATAATEELGRQNEELQAAIDTLRQELGADDDERAAQILALEEGSAALKKDIVALKSERETLLGDLASRDDALAELETKLEAADKGAEDLATDLDEQTRARESAEEDLATARAKVDELGGQNEELQAAVDTLRQELGADDDERAAQILALEDGSAKFKDEVATLTSERDMLRSDLASRDDALAELESELEAAAKDAEQFVTDLEQHERSRESAADDLARAREEIDALGNETQQLKSAIADLEFDLTAARERTAEFEALEKRYAELEDEVEARKAELAERHEDLAARDQAIADLEKELDESREENELAQRRIGELKSPEQLEAAEKVAERLAADLEQQDRLRQAAEDDLATASTEIDGLGREIRDLQTTIADLEAGLEAAGEQRAAELETLEKKRAGLEDEIETRKAEMEALREDLASRDSTIAELDAELEAARQECALAQRRMLELKSPLEVEEIETALEQLAVDLEQESLRRAAAEEELATAKSTVDELSRRNQEWQSTVRDLNVDLQLAGERAIDVDVLKQTVSALRDAVDRKTRELESRDKAFAVLEKQLGALENRRELQMPRAKDLSNAEQAARDKAGTVFSSDAPASSSLTVAKFEQAISGVAAYQTLKEHDPAAYDRLIATYKRFIGLDHSDKQVNDILRAEQAELVEELLPQAADKAILAYARVIVDQLDEFLANGTEPCFTLLIPHSRRGSGELSVFSESTKERELEVLEMTLTSHDPERRFPREKDVLPDLEPILAELIDEYGEENVAALEEAADTDVDKVLMCTIGRTLYARILELPKRRNARALRWLLAP